MARTYIIIITAIALGIAHSVTQFLLWANLEKINDSGSKSTVLWSLISFPAFALVSRASTNRFFWLVFGANSLIWTFVFMMLGLALIYRMDGGRNLR